MAANLKVCIIGAGGRGTAIAAVISKNVLNLKGNFDGRVHIYAYDDPIDNSLLSEVINNRHENVKYLPGIKLPKNLIAVNNLLEAAQNADILIFAMPYTFVKPYCNILAGNVKENAFAVSMIKGLMQERDDEMVLVSDTITELLDIPCYSMMSAQSSMEMAEGKLCEITVGCDDAVHAHLLTAVLKTNNCQVISINDVAGVELCGTLNEIISLGAGFVDGLRFGENTRVAAIHLCVKEMMRFIKTFFPSTKMSTFYETCGIANSVAATYVDKNVNFAQRFITTGKTFQEMEATFLHGRKLLGPLVAAEVNAFLEKALMQHEFPLFTAIHRISQNEAPPELMLEALRNHPDLSGSSISHLLSTEKAPAQGNMDRVLDQVADALPKLRSCLDKILVEANSPNIKTLKVMDDWAQVDEHRVQNLGFQEASAGIPIETEGTPSRLSAEASRIRDEIQKGNVQVGFKMDAREAGRHIRLLLQELPEICTTESVASSGLDKADSELGQGHFVNSSPEHMTNKGISTDNTINDSPNGLDMRKNTRIFDEAGLKKHDKLIKSIRRTIEALGNKVKMENLIAESHMEDENSPFARFHEDENQSSGEATEMRQPEVKPGTEALNEHMLSDSDKQSLQKEQMNPVELRLHDDIEAALDEVPVLDQREHSSTNERAELKELLQWQKLKTDSEDDSPKLSEVGDPAAREDIGNHWGLSDLAEIPVREKDEQRLTTVGNRKPNQNLNEVNVRHFRNKKTQGGHEWDWMLNHKLDTEERLAIERDKTLSKSDQEGLERLNEQLQEALQRDFDGMTSSHDDAPNQELGQDNDLETESDNKRVTQDPAIPLPLKLPTPKRHYREGTPEVQNQPGTFPPPMRESKPLKPKKLQPQRSIPPVEFGEVPETMQSEKEMLDQSEPEAKGNYKTEEPREPPPAFPLPMPESKPRKPKKLQPHRSIPPEFGEVPETMQSEKAMLDHPEPEAKRNYKTELPTEPPSEGKSEAARPPLKKRRLSSEPSETQETTVHSNERSATPKADENREHRDNQQPQVSRPRKKTNSVIRRGGDRQVDFKGQNPFTLDLNLESKHSMGNSQDRDFGMDSLSHKRRRVVVSPPFNPPLNPRVRVPRPPFDVRDHEYHTMIARPVMIVWPSSAKPVKPSLVDATQVKQMAVLPRKVPTASRSLLQISSGIPRTPTLTKILCALHIGLLASYFARSKN